MRVLAVAGAAALAIAVYVTADGSGNNADAAACAASVPVAQALDPLVGGEIAAFQIASQPQKLDGLAFLDSAGEAKTLADVGRQVALVNIWATWCAPCRQEMPALDRLQGALGSDDFAVVPISIDTGDRARPAEFLAGIGVKNLPLYTDPSTKIFDELKTRGLALGLPVTLLIDENGCTLGHMNGPAEWDSPEARALIEAALRGGDTPQG